MNSTGKAASGLQKIYSDTHRVGLGYSVQLTLTVEGEGVASVQALWSPCMPGKRDMRRVWARYVQVRNRFAAEVAARGGNGLAVIVEVAQ